MTAASLLPQPSDRARADHQIPVGIQPTRMPPGSACHAPVLVGNNGDVK